MKRLAIIGQQCAGKTTVATMAGDIIDIGPVAAMKFAAPIYKSLIALYQQKQRGFMQEFGDLAKKHFGEDVFVRAFEREDNRISKLPADCRPALAVCDDVRRIYELDLAKRLGYSVVYVEAPREARKARAEAQGLDFIETHNSETEVPLMKPKADYVLENNFKDAEDLLKACKGMLVALNFLPHNA